MPRETLAMTNTFGQDALQSPNDDTSFMVLLEGVKEGVDSIGGHPVVMRYAGSHQKVYRVSSLGWCCSL